MAMRPGDDVLSTAEGDGPDEAQRSVIALFERGFFAYFDV